MTWCIAASLGLHGAALVATGCLHATLPPAEPTEEFVARVAISFASAASVAIEAPPPPPAPGPPALDDVQLEDVVEPVAFEPLPRDVAWLDASAGRAIDQPEERRDAARLARRVNRGADDAVDAANTAPPPSEPTSEQPTERSSVASLDSVEVLSPLPGANPAPDYPDSARRRGVEGTVLVRCEVAANGLVDRAVVVASSGSVALDHAAVAAARRWRFSRGGVVDVPFVFQLRDRA